MEKIMTYLQNPALEMPPMEELQALVERYPWFSTARIALSSVTGRVDRSLNLWVNPGRCPDLLLRVLDAAVEGVSGSEPVCTAAPTTVPFETAPSATFTDTDIARADDAFAMIDQFLAQDYTRPRPQEPTPGEMEQQEDLARVSVSMDPDLVSEGLAEIYRSQRLYAHAREAYRKLSLLYPEKSVYFAEVLEQMAREEWEAEVNRMIAER